MFPEASSILSHYCFGDGSDLILANNYFKQSSVIGYHVKDMQFGEKRRIGMNQEEDFRLSFALNPLIIEKYHNKIIIKEYITFDKSGQVTTMIGPIPMPDNIVHVFNCTPYFARTEFSINELIYSDLSSSIFIKKIRSIFNRPAKLNTDRNFANLIDFNIVGCNSNNVSIGIANLNKKRGDSKGVFSSVYENNKLNLIPYKGKFLENQWLFYDYYDDLSVIVRKNSQIFLRVKEGSYLYDTQTHKIIAKIEKKMDGKTLNLGNYY